MLSVSEIVTKSLKEKYKPSVIEENVNIDIKNIDKTDLILNESNINNLSSALMVGIISNNILQDMKIKRKFK